MDMTPQEIYQLVAPELVLVEDELRGYTRSDVSPISEIGEYLLNAGGKRIRPALLLLTAKMLGDVSPMAIRLAAVIEFIHNATLVHDDIIDAADTRRGQPSANAQWGNSMTVLAGDWLYMQSFAIALGEKNFDVLNTLIEITQRMVEGELLQLTFLGSADRLAEVGKSLGMAFQLVDDLLDWTSTKDVLGKPVASDLKEGKMTLPVFFALSNGEPEDTVKVQKVLDEREFHSVDRAEILRLVQESDGLDRTRKLAENYALRATQLLEEFPASLYRDAIVQIPQFILNRTA